MLTCLGMGSMVAKMTEGSTLNRKTPILISVGGAPTRINIVDCHVHLLDPDMAHNLVVVGHLHERTRQYQKRLRMDALTPTGRDGRWW
jgi:hypothetical protein